MRKFEFIYYFNSIDFRICFDYEVTKTDIENKIKDYIISKKIFKEDIYLINYSNNLELEFNLYYLENNEWLIEVDNILIYEWWRVNSLQYIK